MSLKISSYENHLGKSDKPYFAHTEHSGQVEPDKFVEIMAAGRTSLSATDLTGAMVLLKEELAKLVADGKFVKTPIGSFYLSAHGKFDNREQAFTPGEGDGEHGVRLHFRPNRDFELELERAADIERAERIEKSLPVVYDLEPKHSNETGAALAGGFLRITGLRMGFDEGDPAQGVFFSNGSEHRASEYLFISRRLIIAQVPESLSSGSYVISVRTMPNGKDLKEAKAQKALALA